MLVSLPVPPTAARGHVDILPSSARMSHHIPLVTGLFSNHVFPIYSKKKLK